MGLSPSRRLEGPEGAQCDHGQLERIRPGGHAGRVGLQALPSFREEPDPLQERYALRTVRALASFSCNHAKCTMIL